MVERFVTWLEQRFDVNPQTTWKIIRRTLAGLASVFFILASTLIIVIDDVFVGIGGLGALNIGDIAPSNIVAPQSRAFASAILTQEARDKASQGVLPVYDPPDPSIARQQSQLAQQIVAYILNVRKDPYAIASQRESDIAKISALALEPRIIEAIVRLNDDTWTLIADEISLLLPRMLRESIRPTDLPAMIAQLSNQVSLRFDTQERNIIVAIVEDLLRPNTFENIESTNAARLSAAAAVTNVTRSFVRGELIVSAGEIITAADYEALQQLGVLRPDDQRLQKVIQAFIASATMLVLIGLYLIHFEPDLVLGNVSKLTLFSMIFLMMLVALRLLGTDNNLYLFPSSALALLFAAIHSQHLALIGAFALALLGGLMSDNSLEATTLIACGGIIAALRLRASDRLNSFFVAGLVVGVINAAVVGMFQLTLLTSDVEVLTSMALAFLSGAVLAPATAIAALFIVTQFFNLTTSLKLLDLAQPNKPLLQRLIREAPGTYQHSLQVANLAEQAALMIGADALLVRVAALYHDIGKMLNPLYFTENQQDIANPHDILNDPYRSAQIIIGHVTEGDELAKQYGLPARIRDFIREHHGTTRVFVFYQRALSAADGDVNAVDASDFSYPGPRPRSRETAILMLADSCEATVRATKPQSKTDIADIVSKIIDDKRQSGQLDRSHLTLNDLTTIRSAFIDMLQGMFHPRINYAEAVKKTTSNTLIASSNPRIETSEVATPPALKRVTMELNLPSLASQADDEAPLPEVPRLISAKHAPTPSANGTNGNAASEASPNPHKEEAE